MIRFLKNPAEPEVPAELDGRILAAAAFQASAYRRRRASRRWALSGAAAALLIGGSALLMTSRDAAPEAGYRVAEVEVDPVWSPMEQEGFNLTCQMASEKDAIQDLYNL